MPKILNTFSESLCLFAIIDFSQNNDYVNANCLQLLNLRTWHERRLQNDAIFLINLLLGFRILSVFHGHNLSPSSHSITPIPSYVYFSLSFKVVPHVFKICEVLRRQSAALSQNLYYFYFSTLHIVINYSFLCFCSSFLCVLLLFLVVCFGTLCSFCYAPLGFRLSSN
jgi:hypothetical protein